MENIKLYTVDIIPNTDYKVIGIVSGSIVLSRHLGRDIVSIIKSIFGGEIKDYTKMLENARKEVNNRMIEEAYKLNANAIISVKYASSSIMQSTCEVFVYGTAIKIK